MADLVTVDNAQSFLDNALRVLTNSPDTRPTAMPVLIQQLADKFQITLDNPLKHDSLYAVRRISFTDPPLADIVELLDEINHDLICDCDSCMRSRDFLLRHFSPELLLAYLTVRVCIELFPGKYTTAVFNDNTTCDFLREVGDLPDNALKPRFVTLFNRQHAVFVAPLTSYLNMIMSEQLLTSEDEDEDSVDPDWDGEEEDEEEDEE